MQGHDDGGPGFARRVGNRTGFGIGPATCVLVMCIGPSEDLLAGVFRQCFSVPHASVFGKQLRQRRTAFESARSVLQGDATVFQVSPGASAIGPEVA